jgi:hypothetical protein
VRFSPSFVSNGPLLEAAGDDHRDPRVSGLGDVLRRLPPDVAAQEERLAVLPLLRLAVEGRGVEATVKLATAAPEGVKRSSGRV